MDGGRGGGGWTDKGVMSWIEAGKQDGGGGFRGHFEIKEHRALKLSLRES